MFLACDDVHDAALFFVGSLGWRLEFETHPDHGDQLACVALGDAQVMLGPAEERWLPAAAREYRGAGVTVYVALSDGDGIGEVYRRHAAAGVTTSELAVRSWGERAFDAVIAGYRFLIAAPGE